MLYTEIKHILFWLLLFEFYGIQIWLFIKYTYFYFFKKIIITFNILQTVYIMKSV